MDLAALATAVMISTYIADERPEADGLGQFCEIVQALGIIGIVVYGIITVLALFAAIVRS